MMFICDKCGVCCKNLNGSEMYKKLHNGNGICKFLKDTECTIYESRPLICRVSESYNVFFKDMVSYEDYLRLTYDCCERLKQERRK